MTKKKDMNTDELHTHASLDKDRKSNLSLYNIKHSTIRELN